MYLAGIELAKKFIQVFPYSVTEKPNELFGRLMASAVRVVSGG